MSYIMNDIKISGYVKDVKDFIKDMSNEGYLNFDNYVDEEQGPIYWVNVEEPYEINELKDVMTINQYAESKSSLDNAIESLAKQYPRLIFEIGTHSTGGGGSYYKYYRGRVVAFSIDPWDLYYDEIEYIAEKIDNNKKLNI